MHSGSQAQKHEKARDQLEDPGIEGRMTLRWILKEQDVTLSRRLIWLRKGTRGTCELGNGYSGSRSVENFLTIHGTASL